MNKKTYWYLYTHRQCVLCQRNETIKERVYDKEKPERWEERHFYEEFACASHFW